MDDKLYLDHRDTTFPASGRIGAWTKARAQPRFDDWEAQELE